MFAKGSVTKNTPTSPASKPAPEYQTPPKTDSNIQRTGGALANRS